jgi:uncharacterized protein YndB with AHSA1/START domain
MPTKITVEVLVNRDVKAAWEAFTSPQAIAQWNFASADWRCPKAENDLRVGGKFNFRMESRDGSMGFDFAGIYTEVVPLERIKYALGDAREVVIEFRAENSKTRVTETFVAEATHSYEQQKGGWQAILDNYRKYAEGNSPGAISPG